MRSNFTSSNYTRQTCRTLISVCQSSGCYVIPAGWTFREGPGQINHSWCFQTEPGRPLCHGLKAVQPALWAITASQASEFEKLRAILALGGFQPLIRPSANPEYKSGRLPMDPNLSRVDVVEFAIGSSDVSFFFVFSLLHVVIVKEWHVIACLWFACVERSDSLWRFLHNLMYNKCFQQFTSHLVVRKPLLCQETFILSGTFLHLVP